MNKGNYHYCLLTCIGGVDFSEDIQLSDSVNLCVTSYWKQVVMPTVLLHCCRYCWHCVVHLMGVFSLRHTWRYPRISVKELKFIQNALAGQQQESVVNLYNYHQVTDIE